MLRKLFVISVLVCGLFALHGFAQQYAYHRVWAVVPLVGTGTADDPKRPLLVPSPTEANSRPEGQRPDLLSYTMQLSDNGKFALVEYTFASPLAFENVLAEEALRNPQMDNASRSLKPISRDGSDIRALPSNVAARKAALESTVPGLKLFERGKTTEAEILTEFRKHKARFTLSNSNVGGAQ